MKYFHLLIQYFKVCPKKLEFCPGAASRSKRLKLEIYISVPHVAGVSPIAVGMTI